MANTETSLIPILKLLSAEKNTPLSLMRELTGLDNAQLKINLQKISEFNYIKDPYTNQLSRPIEWLKPHEIKKNIATKNKISIYICQSTPSTNTFINKLNNNNRDEIINVCLAEEQTCGRGRHQKKWHAMPAKDLCLSLSWARKNKTFPDHAISLVTAISLATSLQPLCTQPIKIKWPNDIYVNNKKLAGILLEKQGDQQIIIGIGLNMSCSSYKSNLACQPIICLEQIANTTPSRNQIAGKIIHTLLNNLNKYETSGLQAFLAEWDKLDISKNKQVQITHNNQQIIGQSKGINLHGEILIDTNGKVQNLHSGSLIVIT